MIVIARLECELASTIPGSSALTITPQGHPLFQYETDGEVQTLKGGFCHDTIFLVNQGFSSIKDRFSQLPEWNEIYGFIQNVDLLFYAVKGGNLNEQCQ